MGNQSINHIRKSSTRNVWLLKCIKISIILDHVRKTENFLTHSIKFICCSASMWYLPDLRSHGLVSARLTRSLGKNRSDSLGSGWIMNNWKQLKLENSQSWWWWERELFWANARNCNKLKWEEGKTSGREQFEACWVFAGLPLTLSLFAGFLYEAEWIFMAVGDFGGVFCN